MIDDRLCDSALSTYCRAHAEYSGQGTLHFSNGESKDCKFHASQFVNGDIWLICDFSTSDFVDPFHIPPTKFEGRTAEDALIFSDRKFWTVLVNGALEPEIHTVFRLEEIYVKIVEEESIKALHFGLTNFIFEGTKHLQCDNSSILVLPLSLKYKTTDTELSICPLKKYEQIKKRLKVIKGIDITCEAVVNLSANMGPEMAEHMIDNLCNIFSIARGTRVQWIYCDQYSESNLKLTRKHASRVTKPYTPYSIIDPRFEARHETQSFVEQVFETYSSRRESYRLDKGTIDAYLDAKAEQDFLETRGVKLAVALETLKAVFLDQADTDISEYIIEDKLFKNLSPSIKNALSKILKSNTVGKRFRGIIYEKIRELNRTPFKRIIENFCKTFNLETDRDNFNRFVASRNKLIHIGRFYCNSATPEEKEECEPLPSPAREYFFLVNFLDRILLKLLGYDGPYIDWSDPENPLRRDRV